MSNINLIDSFKDFKDEKKIDRPYMESVLQEVVKSMLRRKYGTEENCDIILNVDKGDIEIWRTRKVMEDGFSRSEEHTSELQSLMRTSYDVFCLKKKTINHSHTSRYHIKHAT